MTKNQAQNAIIARHLGHVECDKWTTFIAGASMIKGDCDHENCYPKGMCPNYSEDLNAMAKAEANLSEEELGDYVSVLEFVMGIDKKSSRYRKLKLISAPADQRAEAFCKTIHFHSESPESPDPSIPDQEA